MLATHLDSELFDLEVELSYLGVIFLAILLESDMVLLLLFASDGPLLQLLLVPV